jgi:hypothetical protein
MLFLTFIANATRAWRSFLPNGVAALNAANGDDNGIGRSLHGIPRPTRIILAAFTSSNIVNVNSSREVFHEKHETDSNVTIGEYYVEDDVYGMAYLTPYYNARPGE